MGAHRTIAGYELMAMIHKGEGEGATILANNMPAQDVSSAILFGVAA